jgi:hypothetical protein
VSKSAFEEGERVTQEADQAREAELRLALAEALAIIHGLGYTLPPELENYWFALVRGPA